MFKKGEYLVTKGRNNPWIYRANGCDTMLNVVHCQFIGHDGQSRLCLDDQKCHDAWRSMSEMRLATTGEIYNALKISQNEPFNDVLVRLRGVVAGLDGTKKKKLKVCNHDWKEYTGIRESYKFCTKCDAKREGSS